MYHDSLIVNETVFKSTNSRPQCKRNKAKSHNTVILYVMKYEFHCCCSILFFKLYSVGYEIMINEDIGNDSDTMSDFLEFQCRFPFAFFLIVAFS